MCLGFQVLPRFGFHLTRFTLHKSFHCSDFRQLLTGDSIAICLVTVEWVHVRVVIIASLITPPGTQPSLLRLLS